MRSSPLVSCYSLILMLAAPYLRHHFPFPFYQPETRSATVISTTTTFTAAASAAATTTTTTSLNHQSTLIMASQDPQPFNWHLTELGRDFQFQGHGLFLILIFFSIIFLMTLLFLYIHWLCRTRHLSANVSFTSEGHAAGVPASSLGLDATTINSLPITLHCSSAAAKGTECSICLCLFQDKEKVRVLPSCQHAYHCECVDKWLSTQPSCPLCRSSLRVDIPDESAIP